MDMALAATFEGGTPVPRSDQCLENRAAYEQIGQLVLMSALWTSEAGQLTSKGTLRRGVIKAQLVDVLDRLYRG